MKAIILTIGDEILIGQIVDTNSAWIAQKFELLGINIVEMRSISDDRKAILSHLKDAQSHADIIIVTGGLGPTKDDITKEVLAEYLGDEMVFQPSVYEHVSSLLARYNITASTIHKEQCYFPNSAKLFKNDRGTAPGMFFEHNQTYIVSVPGVPVEMKYLINQEIIPFLATKINPTPIYHKTILTVGKGEGVMAEMLEDEINKKPPQISIAYLPGFGTVRIRISIRGIVDEFKAKKMLEGFSNKIIKIINPWIYGFGKEKLSVVVGNMIADQNKMLGTAESCTGGNIAHEITSAAGSSAYFAGSIVSYSNKVKENTLSVNPSSIKNYGAVSETVVREMALGCIAQLNCNYAIATTGIAGPEGGSKEKPVGTIWIAVTDGENVKTRRLSLGNGRQKNIQYTTTSALNLMRLFILETTVSG